MRTAVTHREATDQIRDSKGSPRAATKFKTTFLSACFDVETCQRLQMHIYSKKQNTEQETRIKLKGIKERLENERRRIPAEENTLIVQRGGRETERKKEIESSRSLPLFVPIRHKGKPATFHRRFTCTCRPRTELPRRGRERVIEQSYVQLLLGARFHRSLSLSLSSSARRCRNSKYVAEIRGRRQMDGSKDEKANGEK